MLKRLAEVIWQNDIPLLGADALSGLTTALFSFAFLTRSCQDRDRHTVTLIQGSAYDLPPRINVLGVSKYKEPGAVRALRSVIRPLCHKKARQFPL